MAPADSALLHSTRAPMQQPLQRSPPPRRTHTHTHTGPGAHAPQAGGSTPVPRRSTQPGLHPHRQTSGGEGAVCCTSPRCVTPLHVRPRGTSAHALAAPRENGAQSWSFHGNLAGHGSVAPAHCVCGLRGAAHAKRTPPSLFSIVASNRRQQHPTTKSKLEEKESGRTE